MFKKPSSSSYVPLCSSCDVTRAAVMLLLCLKRTVMPFCLFDAVR